MRRPKLIDMKKTKEKYVKQIEKGGAKRLCYS